MRSIQKLAILFWGGALANLPLAAPAQEIGRPLILPPPAPMIMLQPMPPAPPTHSTSECSSDQSDPCRCLSAEERKGMRICKIGAGTH